jgi:hypothetical protein
MRTGPTASSRLRKLCPATFAMPAFNLSATVNVLRTITNPALICPHYTVSTFDQLPFPLSKALVLQNGKEPDIRAVVLDKDNCFAIPHALEVYPVYSVAYIPALGYYCSFWLIVPVL